MGKLYQRGGVYYADLRSEGLGRYSLKTEDEEVAKARLKADQLGATDNTGCAPKRLDEAIDDMLALKRKETAKQYQNKALHLVRVLGAETDIASIRRADVSDYIATRRDEGMHPHTIHKELVVLRQAFKEAQKRGEFAGSLDVVPQWSAEYEPRTRYLTRAEFSKLIAAAPLPRRSWIMLQAYTSANLGEMRRLGWEHVDLEHGWIQVPGRKRTSRWRRVPIHPELRRFLEGMDPDEPLVPEWRSPNHGLETICRRAGIDRVSTNDLRRTFAAWLKQAGVDSLPVAHMMGHNSTHMVERVYGRLSEDTYRDAISKLPGSAPASTGDTKRGTRRRKKRKR